MRALNATVGAIALVGMVCCVAVAFHTPLGWAWAAWLACGIWQGYFAGTRFGEAITGE